MQEQSEIEEPVISATQKQEERKSQDPHQNDPSRNNSNAKSILKPSSVSKDELGLTKQSLAKKRSPLMQFRQKGTKYKPLFEMFLCYHQEEFFDCRDAQNFPGAPLNFSDMLEDRHRRLSVAKSKGQQKVLAVQPGSNDINFTSQAQSKINNNELLQEQLARALKVNEFDDLDASIFEIGETRIGESRIDDLAEAYDATLTPDALIQLREERRKARMAQSKNAARVKHSRQSSAHRRERAAAEANAQQSFERGSKTSGSRRGSPLKKGVIGGGVASLIEQGS